MTTPSTARPPAWAEATLRLLLKPADRESVTGDLLEEYRDSVLPERGRRRADIWYVMQVAGFVWIKASGGLDEAFVLPWMVVVPGTCCATVGAVVGKTLAWSLRSRLAE